MFKFLKSKKGFTLVELMIVVVIMAILVAVAVPIYSAVTRNARTKTCIANMREITTQIQNYAMSNDTNLGIKEGVSEISFEISYTDGADQGAFPTTAPTDIPAADWTNIKGLFKTIPYCTAGYGYTVTIKAGSGEEAGSVEVDVACLGVGENAEHVYG